MGNPLSSCMVPDIRDPQSSCMCQDDPEVTILLLGLDNAGTTVLLYRLLRGEAVRTLPTIGFNVERVSFRRKVWRIWDYGGQRRVREFLWPQLYGSAHAIIFVVDSEEAERINDEACEEVAKIMDDLRLCEAPLLVFANKQDQPQALSAEEVADKLGLFSMTNRRWHIQGLCAITGEGLYEGLDWLYEMLHKTEPMLPPTSDLSPVAVDQPGQAVANKDVTIWDEPGGANARRIGTLPRETCVNVLELMPASSCTALTHGRINEPIAGWISVHSGQMRRGTFVVTLRAGAGEHGCKNVTCYNMAGDELASFDCDALQPGSVMELEQHISKLVGRNASSVKLVLPTGPLVPDLGQLAEMFCGRQCQK
eukprot:TRINITY_DN53122_c0_g1_i1.p1 TRINITY_DN53122_c0_g1~~TRINITY_DN53122_c0_g1_i1.p1  ORF type:complete len:366 (-),score=37.16 TRINITY_DN53122_c0_g1_i1:35-1132(-)